jgi:hypothetical protein
MKKLVLHACLFVLALCASQSNASAQLIPSADGKTVYDAHLHARWLADANFANAPEGRTIAANAAISTISRGGSMDYPTAILWLQALNTLNQNGNPGLLGHTTWTIPTSPVDGSPRDPGCTSVGPGGSGFAFGCTDADLAELFDLNTALGLRWPNTAVAVPDIQAGPFHNFQPYLYWTKTQKHAFSFNTGWAGSNTSTHYMYVLPMIKHRVTSEYGGQVQVDYIPAGVGTLEVSTDGQLVYDPDVDVTFLADADLAKTQTFGAQCASYLPQNDPNEGDATFPPGIPCIAPDGSMPNTDDNFSIATEWINGMNAYQGTGWLGRQDWELPPDTNGCGNFLCYDTPMGNLYYNQFLLAQGTPIVTATNSNVGPFYNVQPYLYWSCGAPVAGCETRTPRVSTQEWSFSFGNGFQGTDLQVNYLYVMIYFPQTPAQALIEAILKDLGNRPELNAFLVEANNIIAAPNANAKAGRLGAFLNHVNAQTGNLLTVAQAKELIALAEIN